MTFAHKRILSCVLLGLCSLGWVGRLNADPITFATGAFLDSNIPNSSTLNLTLGTLGVVTPPQPASNSSGQLPLGAYALNSLTIGLGPFSSNPGAVTMSDLVVTGTQGADAGKTATFHFTGGQAKLSENGPADSIQGFVNLTSSNITGIDFGPSGGLFFFDFSTQGTTFTPGNPGSVVGSPTSSSFNLTSVAVPEPGSIVAWGLAGFVGTLALRRNARVVAQG